MAHKKSGGSSTIGRDSAGRRYGVKAYGGTTVTAGSIIVRQLGTGIYPGLNAGIGKDHTVYSKIDGVVQFERWGKTRKKASVYPVA